MATSSEKKNVSDLRVVELKAELEKRNLDKAGVKAVLVERLQEALREEGHDPETYLMESTDNGLSKKVPGTKKSPRGANSQDEEDMEDEDAEMEVGEEEENGIDVNQDEATVNENEEAEQEEEEEQEGGDVDMAAEAPDNLVEDEEIMDEEKLLLLEEEGLEGEDTVVHREEAEEEADIDQLDMEEFTEVKEDEEVPVNVQESESTEVLNETGAGDASVEESAEAPAEEDVCAEEQQSVVSAVETPQTAAPTASTIPVSNPNSISSAAAVVDTSPSKLDSAAPVCKTSPAAVKKPAATAAKPAAAAAQPGGATKMVSPKTVTQKSGVTAAVSKQSPVIAKSTAGQKVVTSTPKVAQAGKAAGALAAGNVSAIPPADGVTAEPDDKTSSVFEATDYSFDVQVDDTMIREIDADLEEGEKTVEGHTHAAGDGQVSEKTGDNSTQPDESIADPASSTDTKVPEQPAAATEGQTAETAKTQDSAPKDNKKAEEKKDEKDGKPVKSGVAAKPVKGKDDKAASNSRNLWISGLSSSTRATDLKSLLGKYGKVIGAKVVTNARSPGWRCYGFVTMASADETTKCIQHLHRTELHGKMISVERFSSFKTKTDGASKTAPPGKTSGADQSSAGKTTGTTSSKTTAAKKDDKKTTDHKEGEKKGDKDSGKKVVKKDDLQGKKDDKKTEKSPRKDDRDSKSIRSGRSSRDRSSHTSAGRTREQKERDMLSFEKIRAERERERLRQKEKELRNEERFRLQELERERMRQKMIHKKQREEAMMLEREKDRLRMEKEKLEFERQEAERLRRESARMKRLAEERLRRDQERLAAERRAAKRPAPPKSRMDMDDIWGEAAKQARKDAGFKSTYSERGGEGGRFTERQGGYERKVEKYDRREDNGRYESRREDFHRPEREEHRFTERGFENNREYRREERGSHRNMQEDFRGSGRGRQGHGGSRDTRKVVSSRQAWGGPADGGHSKTESGWGRPGGLEQGTGSRERWLGSSSLGGSQHQRGSGGATSYGSHSSGLGTSSAGSNLYMSSGAPQSSSGILGGSSLSRQQDTRFNIAAITARRF